VNARDAKRYERMQRRLFAAGALLSMWLGYLVWAAA
jgi:hypothetical protein